MNYPTFTHSPGRRPNKNTPPAEDVNTTQPAPLSSSNATVSPPNPPKADTPKPQSETKASDSKSDSAYFVAILLLIFILPLLYLRVPCKSCKQRTMNKAGICDSCQTKMRVEDVLQQQEVRRKAEEERRCAASVRAEEQRSFTGDQFEQLVESLFMKDGYKVSRRERTGDKGVDLVLEIKGVRDVLQCKRWRGDVGLPVIREFYGSMLHAGARHGFAITTASFSQGAREFAIGKPITLIDGPRLRGWINGKRSNSGGYSNSGPGREEFDPHEVLGLSKGATESEIRAAYKALMAKYHPDKVTHLGEEFQEIAKEKAQAINRAYQTLKPK